MIDGFAQAFSGDVFKGKIRQRPPRQPFCSCLVATNSAFLDVLNAELESKSKMFVWSSCLATLDFRAKKPQGTGKFSRVFPWELEKPHCRLCADEISRWVIDRGFA